MQGKPEQIQKGSVQIRNNAKMTSEHLIRCKDLHYLLHELLHQPLQLSHPACLLLSIMLSLLGCQLCMLCLLLKAVGPVIGLLGIQKVLLGSTDS